jgi:hypothetical protein
LPSIHNINDEEKPSKAFDIEQKKEIIAYSYEQINDLV